MTRRLPLIATTRREHPEEASKFNRDCGIILLNLSDPPH
jgi:hypothetical protein